MHGPMYIKYTGIVSVMVKCLWRNGGIIFTEGNWRTRRETRPSATLSTTNPTFLSFMWKVNIEDSPFCGPVPLLFLNIRLSRRWVLIVRSSPLLRRIGWLSSLADVDALAKCRRAIESLFFGTAPCVAWSVHLLAQGLEGPEFDSGQEQEEIFVFLQTPWTACWVGTGASFPEGKAAGHEADHFIYCWS